MNNSKNVTTNYKEVSIDVGGIEKRYKNPLTKLYQYEYALFAAISELFASVTSKSMCTESLMLYFKELPIKSGDSEAKRSITQEGLLNLMRSFVSKNVSGHITFPMMNICAADAYTRLNGDGSHTFIFTDGIYAFSIHLKMPRKGSALKLEVFDLPPVSIVKNGKIINDAKRTVA